MVENLLLCPFCGGEPKLDAENEPKRVGAFIGEYYVRVWHYCGNEAHMYAATSFHDSDRQTAIEKAIAAWNARTERTCRMEYNEKASGDELYPTEAYTCSSCRCVTLDGKPNYCSNCGAKVVN